MAQLIYLTRFGDLLGQWMATVFGVSIIVELLRPCWGPVFTVRLVPAIWQKPAMAFVAKSGRCRRSLILQPFWCRVIFYKLTLHSLDLVGIRC